MKFTSFFTIVLLCLPLITWGQRATISGQVTDKQSGETLVGVTVVEQDTANGTITGDNGQYSLTVNIGSTVTFSYIGYETYKMVVTEGGKFPIGLATEYSNLDEVVIVGYTTQKKKDITGAIAIVDLKDIENAPYSNVLQSIQGKASGVTIQQDGQPGSGRTNLKIRGVTTLNNNTPLYVIDGVPTTEDLSNLNPNDIESIQILKDAASASIYGSRSAAGVVIITTKKGKDGVMNIDAGTQFGMQTLGNKIELLNATEWGEVYWQAAQNDGLTPNHPIYGNGPTPVIDTNPFLIPNGKQIYQYSPEGTDWYDEVYQNALSHQHFVNFSQGTDKGSYMMGFSYFDQEGLIKQTYYDRMTGRVNSTLNVTDWLSVGENLSVTFSEQVQIGTQQGQDGIPLDVIRQHPILPVFDFEGNYAGKLAGYPDVRNMTSVLEKNRDNTTDSWRIFGNAYAEANLLKMINVLPNTHSLKLKTSFGIDYSNYYDIRFNAKFSEGDFDVQNNLLFNSFGRGITSTWTNTLVYNYEKKAHNLQVMGGMEAVQYDFFFLSGARTDFEIESPTFTYLSAGAGSQTNAGGGTEWGLYSYFGRLDYAYNSKYILSATLRHDQTSRLNTSGFFPAASLGWWISEEKFFKNVAGNGVNLKLRTSYGQQGNQNVGDFSTLSTLGADPNHADYDLNGTNSGVLQGYRVLTRGNPNLRWETTTQYNAGFDLSMLDGRFNVVFDYYTKTTKDILLNPAQISAIGEGEAPFVNSATMKNNGVDLGLSYRWIMKSGLDLDFSGQATYFTNEVIDLGANIGSLGNEGELYLPGSDGPTRVTVGYPIGEFYGWQADGLFQSQTDVDGHADQPGKGIGRIKYADLNADGQINDDDRTYLGSPYPDLSYGFNLIASYKRFSLAASLYGAIGQKVYNEMRWYMDFAQNGNFNRSTRILDAWSPSNTSSTIPAPTLANANNENRASSYFVEDADYMKVRSVRLVYDLPEKFAKNFRIQVYGEVQNLAVFSSYTGIDPEVPFAGDVNFPGIDRGVYPLPRTFLMGLNVKIK